jgi:hypothetical protein
MNPFIFEKILDPYPTILGFLDRLNRQINLSTGNFNPEQYGTLTAAKRTGKPFIIGIIPPDNVVNFRPIETKLQSKGDDWDLGSTKGTPRSVKSTSPVAKAESQAAGELPFSNNQLVQMAHDGTLGPANDPVVPLGGGQINQASLDILAGSGFYSAANTVAKRQMTTPEDMMVVFWGYCRLKLIKHRVRQKWLRILLKCQPLNN